MIERIAFAVAIVAVATALAGIARRRRRSDAPTQPRRSLPDQIDRDDFVHPRAAWLVVIFSSADCAVCAGVIAKARVLASEDVAVQDVSYQDHRALHARYGIDAVPAILVADTDGVVRYGAFGPVTATDLWAAVAEARDPGSVPFDDACSD